jgi:hypothetical protein
MVGKSSRNPDITVILTAKSPPITFRARAREKRKL